MKILKNFLFAIAIKRLVTATKVDFARLNESTARLPLPDSPEIKLFDLEERLVSHNDSLRFFEGQSGSSVERKAAGLFYAMVAENYLRPLTKQTESIELHSLRNGFLNEVENSLPIHSMSFDHLQYFKERSLKSRNTSNGDPDKKTDYEIFLKSTFDYSYNSPFLKANPFNEMLCGLVEKFSSNKFDKLKTIQKGLKIETRHLPYQLRTDDSDFLISLIRTSQNNHGVVFSELLIYKQNNVDLTLFRFDKKLGVGILCHIFITPKFASPVFLSSSDSLKTPKNKGTSEESSHTQKSETESPKTINDRTYKPNEKISKEYLGKIHLHVDDFVMVNSSSLFDYVPLSVSTLLMNLVIQKKFLKDRIHSLEKEFPNTQFVN
jgi:hypothetical protein